MKYTTIAYVETQDASAAMINVAGLADGHVRVVGDFIYVPAGFNKLMGVYAAGVTPLRAQVRAPSLRTVFNQEVSPMSGAITPPTATPFMDLFDNPLPLMDAEPMEALIQAGAGAQYGVIIVFLGDGAAEPVKGEIRSIRAVGGAAAVAYTWTASALTFAETLPAGRYQLVGARFQSTTAIAARFRFPGQFALPGVLGVGAKNTVLPPQFNKGLMGVMGEFMHDAPPSAEILCVAADAAAVQIFDLDLIYLGK